MLCVYEFKQLVGEMKLTTILVLKIRLNEMQHQQNHIWFKGKNLKIKHINDIKYIFKESCK